MKNNRHLRQQYPLFSVPSSIYEIFFINKWTTMFTMNLILDHVRNCTQYTCDTESEISNNTLALIQIQTLPQASSSFILLVELAHLPSFESSIMVKIKEFFQSIFRSSNIFYSWGPFRSEISPIKNHGLFDWPIAATVIDIQVKFSSWYSWASSHCEMCCPPSSSSNGEKINSNKQNDMSFRCICRKPNPYRVGEKWSLQQAIIHTYDMFLDKSMRLNHWSKGLDGNHSSLSTRTRNGMINYAINDCLATSCLIQPVLAYWSFQRVINVDIHVLFRVPESLCSNENEIMEKKINQRINLNAILHGIEPISDDDDEIYVHQLIPSITIKQHEDEQNSNEQQSNDKILVNNIELIIEENNDIIFDNNEELKSIKGKSVEGKSVEGKSIEEKPVKEKPIKEESIEKKRRRHKDRPQEYKQRRNKRRNNILRARRYQQYFTRSFYYKFNLRLMRKIISRLGIQNPHIKESDGKLIIGVKHDQMKQRYEEIIGKDLFDRKNYEYYRRHYQHHHKRQ